MFEIPGRDDIRRIVIDADTINGRTRPRIYSENSKELKWSDDGRLNPAA